MTWPVLIEVWPGEVLGFVPDLPGLQVSANTPDEAFELISDAVTPWVAWLIEGELVPEETRVQPLDRSEVANARDKVGPFFSLDGIVPDVDAVELALAVGRACLSDLLFVRDDVSPERLPEADRVLRHVAELDRWYATRSASADAKPFQSIEDELVQSASFFEESVDLQTNGTGPGIWTVDGEQWSLAKVLRRRTGHVREHLPEVMACLG